MCEHGNEIFLIVPIPANLSHTGKFRWETKAIDSCIATIVDALNKAGIYTAGCCCGHGRIDGNIILHDGRVLIIRTNNRLEENMRTIKMLSLAKEYEKIIDMCNNILEEIEKTG